MKTSITFISDTHSKHAYCTADLPGGDILIHSGDMSSVGDSQALKLLNNAFEKGSELIQQTTIRLGNVKINPDGTIG